MMIKTRLQRYAAFFVKKGLLWEMVQERQNWLDSSWGSMNLPPVGNPKNRRFLPNHFDLEAFWLSKSAKKAGKIPAQKDFSNFFSRKNGHFSGKYFNKPGDFTAETNGLVAPKNPLFYKKINLCLNYCHKKPIIFFQQTRKYVFVEGNGVLHFCTVNKR